MSELIFGKKILKWTRTNVSRKKLLRWKRYNKRTKNIRRKARKENTSVDKCALNILQRLFLKYPNHTKRVCKNYALFHRIRKHSIIVVSELGFGYKECVYREALTRRLIDDGFIVTSEVTTPIISSGHYLSNVADKVDILVDDSVVLELKTANKILQKHIDQLHRYFRGNPRRKVGMVICFKDASSLIPCKPVMFRTLLVRD